MSNESSPNWETGLTALEALHDPGQIQQQVLLDILRYAGALGGLIAMTGRDGGPFQVLCTQHVPAAVLNRLPEINLRDGSAFAAAMHGDRPFRLGDTHSVPLAADPQAGDLSGTLIVPVHDRDGPVALLALYAPHGLGDAQLAGLQRLGRQVLPALQRAQLLRALRSSEAQAATMLEVLEEGVMLVDLSGRPVQANAAAHRITGLTDLREFPNVFDPAWKLMDPAGFPLPTGAYPAVQALRTGVTVRDTQVLFTRPDGEWIIASLNAIPLLEGGQQAGAVVSFTDVTASYLLQRQLEAQALHDPLTGLPNRRQVTTLLKQLCGERPPPPTAVMILTLHNFPNLLDRIGRQGADRLIQLVAQRLEDAVSDRGVAAHLTEHEFLLLLTRPGPPEPAGPELLSGPESLVGPESPGETDRSDDPAGQWAAQLLDRLNGTFDLDGQAVHVTFRLGYALHPEDGRTPAELLRHADLALKHTGHSPAARRFEPVMAADVERRLRLEECLQRAVATGTLSVHYQPVMAVPQREIRSLEALLRWQDPVLGTVSPAEFIPVAESSGLINDLGTFVLREALCQAVRWNARRRAPLSVNVNVSVTQFSSGTFPDVVRDALHRTGADPRWLTLEVTEAVAAQDLPSVTRQLHALKALGARIALDDFGTGYSSLALLSQLPIDFLKLDRLLVQGVHLDPRRQVLLRSVVHLGLELGFVVVAEGVELPEELSFVQACGCAHVQGFLLARPQSPQQLNLNAPHH
ncbi:bifunctional diguanylate cyclase/phosphodiesterase [Deinococcus sp. RIT780]|uniref:putative bifunctional diguanylate cyclase/phosphodiesterase n=2 Tax=unclassified Deinococcus TaxID=2623546 RepID=UPI001C890B93|nr:EAL domain-containing protein [Deinococcus sp. RIT780]MBX8465901.1 EAL domain-containing protein [Deinococcus sp. RIT780]